MATDTQQILDAAREQGFEVTLTGRDHWRVAKAGAVGGYTMSKSPSDWRSRNNALSGLKKMGLVWPPSAYEKPKNGSDSSLSPRQRVIEALTGFTMTSDRLAVELGEDPRKVVGWLTRMQEGGDVHTIGHTPDGKRIYKLGPPEPAKKPRAKFARGKSGGIVGRAVLAALADGPLTSGQLRDRIAPKVDCGTSSVSSAAINLVKLGKVEREKNKGMGYTYKLAGWVAPSAAPGAVDGEIERAAAIICGAGDVDETMGGAAEGEGAPEAAYKEEAPVEDRTEELVRFFDMEKVRRMAPDLLADPKQRYIRILLTKLEQEWSPDIADRLDRMLAE